MKNFINWKYIVIVLSLLSFLSNALPVSNNNSVEEIVYLSNKNIQELKNKSNEKIYEEKEDKEVKVKSDSSPSYVVEEIIEKQNNVNMTEKITDTSKDLKKPITEIDSKKPRVNGKHNNKIIVDDKEVTPNPNKIKSDDTNHSSNNDNKQSKNDEEEIKLDEEEYEKYHNDDFNINEDKERNNDNKENINVKENLDNNNTTNNYNNYVNSNESVNSYVQSPDNSGSNETYENSDIKKAIYASGVVMGVLLFFVIGNFVMKVKANCDSKIPQPGNRSLSIDSFELGVGADDINSILSLETMECSNVNQAYVIDDDNNKKNIAKIYEIKGFKDHIFSRSSFISRNDSYNSLFRLSTNLEDSTMSSNISYSFYQ